MAELPTRKGYMFYFGGKCFGLKDHRDIIAPPNSYCKPSLSTLDSQILGPVYKSGPYLKKLMLLLTLLDSLDGVPRISRANQVYGYFALRWNAIEHWDLPYAGRWKTFFDGIIRHIKLNKMRELYQRGNTAEHKFIAENCSCISEVKENDVCDASNSLPCLPKRCLIM